MPDLMFVMHRVLKNFGENTQLTNQSQKYFKPQSN